jgi:hypothetical protein
MAEALRDVAAVVIVFAYTGTRVSTGNTENAEAPPGESGASFGKQGIGRGGDLLLRYVCGSRKKVQNKQRRLSGVCSLGRVAVELDRQFPSIA